MGRGRDRWLGNVVFCRRVADALDVGDRLAGPVGSRSGEAGLAVVADFDTEAVGVRREGLAVQGMALEQALQLDGVAPGEGLTRLVAVQHFGEVEPGLVLAGEARVVEDDRDRGGHLRSFSKSVGQTR